MESVKEPLPRKKISHSHLLKLILAEMRKMEGGNKEMVKAMKEQNRFMYALMRNQKEIMSNLNKTQTNWSTVK